MQLFLLYLFIFPPLSKSFTYASRITSSIHHPFSLIPQVPTSISTTPTTPYNYNSIPISHIQHHSSPSKPPLTDYLNQFIPSTPLQYTWPPQNLLSIPTLHPHSTHAPPPINHVSATYYPIFLTIPFPCTLPPHPFVTHLSNHLSFTTLYIHRSHSFLPPRLTYQHCTSAFFMSHLINTTTHSPDRLLHLQRPLPQPYTKHHHSPHHNSSTTVHPTINLSYVSIPLTPPAAV